jgi:FMN phosphatase YigB (HAD superfamily)
MNDEKIKSSIISDLLKIDRYRSQVEDPDKSFLHGNYTELSIDDLKKIHDIYTRYLLDYGHLGEPYPSVIETLEYTNQQIDGFVNNHKVQLSKPELV